MEIKELVDEVIALKNKTITDEVFLLIQNNRDFMKKYLVLVQEHGLQTVNQQIGRMVMTKYGLTHDTERNYEPESTLISSHQVFD
jgi:hypothetical protein